MRLEKRIFFNIIIKNYSIFKKYSFSNKFFDHFLQIQREIQPDAEGNNYYVASIYYKKF